MRTVFILMFATLYAGMFAVQGNAQPEEKQKVAVYVTGGTNDNINKVIGSKLVQAIIKNGKYSAVERTDAIIAMLRKEQNYQRSGNVDDNQIGRMGKELGVNFVCVAEVVEAFGAKYISARLVDADRMEAVEFADVDGNMNDMTSLVKMSETVAARLLGGGIEAAPSDNVNKAPQNSSDTPSQDGEKTPSPNSGKTVDTGAAWNPHGSDLVYVAGSGS
ncbi:MAG: CsgG/HfaB family protein, partial [Prevotellaceae bacterium]|nr:CsgG/HfaB family protein [Prevotellaceae bacterium]